MSPVVASKTGVANGVDGAIASVLSSSSSCARSANAFVERARVRATIGCVVGVAGERVRVGIVVQLLSVCCGVRSTPGGGVCLTRGVGAGSTPGGGVGPTPGGGGVSASLCGVTSRRTCLNSSIAANWTAVGGSGQPVRLALMVCSA